MAQADLRHWLNEPMPVLLIVYDASSDRAYWVYVQRYWEEQRRKPVTGRDATLTLHVPMRNVVNERAIREFARFRDNVLAQTRGVIRRHD